MLAAPKLIVKSTQHCIVPPLTDELIAMYECIADDATPQVQDDLVVCLRAVKTWWGLPESSDAGFTHPLGTGRIIPLDESTKAAISGVVPPRAEVVEMQRRFDSLQHGPLKESAFHLIAHLYQLSIGIEPFTTDKLTKV